MTDGVGFRPADFYSRSSSPCEEFTHHIWFLKVAFAFTAVQYGEPKQRVKLKVKYRYALKKNYGIIWVFFPNSRPPTKNWG